MRVPPTDLPNLQQIREKPRRVRPRNPDEAQFNDLEYRDLLRAGRAEYGYGFSALHLGLARTSHLSNR
jgi:hypothetical protein